MSDAFELQSSDAPRSVGRNGFAHPYAHYVEIYATQERQLKNWKKKGCDAAGEPVDLPPLDDPAKMPEWFVRHFPRYTVPARILLAAEKAKSAGNATRKSAPPDEKKSREPNQSTPPKGTPTPDPAENTRAQIDNFDDVVGLDLETAVIRQRKSLAVLQRDYESALKDPAASEELITLRAGRVDKCLERLRKLEHSLDEMRVARGELVDIAHVREDLQRVHTFMATSLVASLADRLGVARAAAQAFADDWFAQLRNSRFATGTEPAPEVPRAA